MTHSGMESGACMACAHSGLSPVMPAVDRDGTSNDEADALCARHRSFLTEGFCVVCGRREAWVVLHETSDIGGCRPCFVVCFGEDAARGVEAAWRSLDEAASL